MSATPVYETDTYPLRAEALAALKPGDVVVVKGRYHNTPATVTRVTAARVTVQEINGAPPKVFIIKSGRMLGTSDPWVNYALHPASPGLMQAKLAEKAIANVDNRTDSLAQTVRKLRQLARDGYIHVDAAAEIETEFNKVVALIATHMPEGVKF